MDSDTRAGLPHTKTKQEKIMDQLRLIAEDVSPVRNARLAAAIVVKGKVRSIGVNQWKTNTLQRRFQRHEKSIHSHAEISAINNFLKRHSKEELERATLYVVRRKMVGTHDHSMVDGLAAPCPGCQKAINYYGIKKVVHTYG